MPEQPGIVVDGAARRHESRCSSSSPTPTTSISALPDQWRRGPKAGIEVSYCIVTDGDAGGSDRSLPAPEMARIRRGEQQEAAAEVGVNDVVFLGYPDGRADPILELRRDMSREIRRRPSRPGGVPVARADLGPALRQPP